MHIYIIYWVSAITNLKDSTERTLSKASFEDGAEVGTQKSEEDIEEGVQEDELETLKKAPKKMGWKRWRIFRGVKKKASKKAPKKMKNTLSWSFKWHGDKATCRRHDKTCLGAEPYSK